MMFMIFHAFENNLKEPLVFFICHINLHLPGAQAAPRYQMLDYFRENKKEGHEWLDKPITIYKKYLVSIFHSTKLLADQRVIMKMMPMTGQMLFSFLIYTKDT